MDRFLRVFLPTFEQKFLTKNFNVQRMKKKKKKEKKKKKNRTIMKKNKQERLVNKNKLENYQDQISRDTDLQTSTDFLLNSFV